MADTAARVMHPVWLRRSLEIVVPLFVWGVITAPAWAAVVAPVALSFGIILFSLYWLWKSAVFAIGVVIGSVRMRRALARDWESDAAALPGEQRVQHVVFFPTYGESEEILADSLHHLALQTFPLDRVTVVLAFEERDTQAPGRARKLAARFAPLFRDFLITFHPADLKGEVKGKSSNLAWAARRLQEELIDTGRLEADHTLVTVCDADSRLHHQYLSAITQQALDHPHGWVHVFQPVMFFYANHWRLPAPLRAVNSVYSQYALARMVFAHRIVTQSTYSLSWTAASDVGFWDADVIPEDSHMFFKVFFHYGSRTRVTPIFLPVYADAAEGSTLASAARNSYLQIVRWAYGVVDVPYVVMCALRARHIPLHTRLLRVFWYVEEHVMWPTHWFLLTLGGLLPHLVNPGFAQSAFGVWQATMVSAILTLCMPFLAVVVVADWHLRPEHPRGERLVHHLSALASFAALPILGLFLTAIPALEAHTRLLFGRYLEYRVTEKLPALARFRDRPVRRLAGVSLDQPFQAWPYAPGGTTAVTDAVLLIYRDLR